MMEITQIAVVALSIACGCLGWFARELWNTVQNLRLDVNNFKVLVASDYVRYDRLTEAMRPILESLHDLKQTLKEKADKK